MIRRAYYCAAYFVSWAVFGLGALALALVCPVFFLFRRWSGRRRAVRGAIRVLFGIWVAWLRAAGLVRVIWRGVPPEGLPRGTVYAANHPGLLDATFVLSRLPDACCIFKAGIRHNPFLFFAAFAADYVAGDEGIDLVHQTGAQVAEGGNVLIFPEGTRTDRDRTLNPLKPGFVYIARRARAPIRLLAIRSSRDLLPRGTPWWRVPTLPARVEIECGEALHAHAAGDAGETTAEIQRLLLAHLGTPA